MAGALKLLPPIHRCEIHLRGRATDSSYAVICDRCGCVGTTTDMKTAEHIALLHEEFIAVLVDRWEVPK